MLLFFVKIWYNRPQQNIAKQKTIQGAKMKNQATKNRYSFVFLGHFRQGAFCLCYTFYKIKKAKISRDFKEEP